MNLKILLAVVNCARKISPPSPPPLLPPQHKSIKVRTKKGKVQTEKRFFFAKVTNKFEIMSIMDREEHLEESEKIIRHEERETTIIAPQSQLEATKK